MKVEIPNGQYCYFSDRGKPCPYWSMNKNKPYQENGYCSYLKQGDWEVTHMSLLWDNYKKLIKKNRAIVLFGSEPFSSALRMSNINWFKYDWIWDKVKPSGFQIAKYLPMKRHEIISVFCEGSPLWFPIKEMRKKSISGKVACKSDSSPLAYIDNKTRTYDDKNPQSILKYSKTLDGKHIHPTQKPVALFQYLIKTYSKKNDLILDNCIGSGTTALACENLNRRWIGIYLKEKYCQQAAERIDRLQTQDSKPHSNVKRKGMRPYL